MNTIFSPHSFLTNNNEKRNTPFLYHFRNDLRLLLLITYFPSYLFFFFRPYPKASWKRQLLRDAQPQPSLPVLRAPQHPDLENIYLFLPLLPNLLSIPLLLHLHTFAENLFLLPQVLSFPLPFPLILCIISLHYTLLCFSFYYHCYLPPQMSFLSRSSPFPSPPPSSSFIKYRNSFASCTTTELFCYWKREGGGEEWGRMAPLI